MYNESIMPKQATSNVYLRDPPNGRQPLYNGQIPGRYIKWNIWNFREADT